MEKTNDIDTISLSKNIYTQNIVVSNRPKIKLLFLGATFHIQLTKAANNIEQAFTLQSMAIFRGLFFYF